MLTSYLVTNAIVLPMSGWLASTIGAQRYFLGCIIGFSVTSLLCGLAPSLPLLILARGLQGITGGGLQPNAQAILADAFPPQKRGQAFAVYGIAVVFAPAIGPTLGGWITDNFSWRWVFLLNVPVGICCRCWRRACSSIRRQQVAPRKRAREAASLRLYRLRAAGRRHVRAADRARQGAGGRLVRLDLHHRPRRSPRSSLVAFVVWELRRADPIVDLRLFADRNFAVGNLLMFMLGFILLGSTVLLPLFVQSLLGYTATDAGLVISPGGFAIMLMMPVVGILVAQGRCALADRLRPGRDALALFSHDRASTSTSITPRSPGRASTSRWGWRFLFIPINTVAFRRAAEKNNNASAIINMMRNLGGSFGIAIVTTLLARRQQYHQNVLVEHVTPYSSQYDTTIQALQQAYRRPSASAADALQQAQAQLYAMVQKQAAMLSYIDSFWALAVILVAMVPLVFLLRKPPPGAAQPQGH